MNHRHWNTGVITASTLALAALFFVRCGSVDVGGLDQDNFSNTKSNSIDCAASPAAFAADVVPVFSSKGCAASGCHQGSSPGGGLNLDSSLGTSGQYDQSTASARVNTSDPASSKMLRKPLGLDNHGGGKKFSSTKDSNYVKIYCWIDAGAQNN